MAKGEIQTPNISKVYCKGQGHNSKMILEVRNLFTNKAPFPWSADKISSSRAISSASASAGVPERYDKGPGTTGTTGYRYGRGFKEGWAAL